MKRVLITGANGFTGRALIETLAGSEWEVIPMTQVKTGLENEVTVDFTEERFVEVLHNLPSVVAVVHLATRVGWDGSSRAELFQPNVLATTQLVHWALQQRSHFVFSSAALIAGSHNPRITMNLALNLNTDNDYLYSKWLAEEIIRMSGISHTILRISGIFGKDGPSHLGINKAIAGALRGAPPVQCGDGKIKRNYIYVKDLCSIIKSCIDQKIEGCHLTAGSEVNTMAEMLQTICDILLPGTKPKTEPCSPGNAKGEHDQIVEPSPLLPQSRSFRDAVQNIKLNGDKC